MPFLVDSRLSKLPTSAKAATSTLCASIKSLTVEMEPDWSTFSELWYHRLTQTWLKTVTLPGDSVLEIGVGNGDYTYMLPLHREYVLTDLQISRRLKAHLQKGMRVCQLDAETLPFRNDAFELVISHQVIEHMSVPSAFVREVARVTRQGRCALVSTVIKGPFALGLYRNVRGERVLAPDHLREFDSLTEFLSFFDDLGLTPIFSCVRPIAFPLKRYIPRQFVKRHRRLVEALALPVPLYYRQVFAAFKKSKRVP